MEPARATADTRLGITPPLEASDADFLAGFSRHAVGAHGQRVPPSADRAARTWPGQPAVPSPWVPCADGCCLVLALAGADTAGQWLRFLIAEFLTEQHRVDGRVEVPRRMGSRPVLLIVEAGDVFEGELAGGGEPRPWGYRPSAIESDPSQPSEVRVSPRPHRDATVTRPMRLAVRLTAYVLVLATATGCGGSASQDDAPSSATDPSTSASTTPSDTSGSSSQTLSVGDTVEPGQAVIVSTSNVDGTATQLASALVDDRTLEAFVVDADARLADDVRTAVGAVQVPAGSTLFGSVVAVGCDRPVAVSWTKTLEGIEATAQLPKSGVQCLVPVTSVALFLVTDAA